MTTCEIEYNMETASDRLKALMDEANLNQKELAETIGRTKSLISGYMKPDSKPSDIILRLLEDKLGWSARWIRTGEGPKKVNVILEGENEKQLLNSWALANEHPATNEPVSPYNARHKGTSDKLNMWWVPAKAEAGFIRGFAARLFPSMIQRGSMPLIQGECFAFEIDGFSMFPEFMPGTYVLCTTLEDAGWLRKGRSYVFQTADGLIIKYFDRLESDKIYMTAANNNFNPVEPIAIEDIQQLYNIEFSMNRPKPQ